MSSPHPHPSLAPGSLIGGKYRILCELGAGGYGRVYGAEHCNLGTRVAIKVRHEPDPQGRLLHEARLAASLSSPYSVRVFDVGQLDGGAPYVVMEYLEGQNLRQHLGERGPVPAYQALDWALQICSALREAHAIGLIHRDIKPSNLLLVGRPGLDVHVKLVDFGIAKNVLSPRVDLLTDSGVVVGSPAYLAPERLRAGVATPQSDIWSFGVVLFEMLSAELPFDAPTASGMLAAIAADPPRSLLQVAPGIPPSLEAIAARCLRKRPEDRFGSVADLATALRRARRSAPAPESVRTPLLQADTQKTVSVLAPQPMFAPGSNRRARHTPSRRARRRRFGWVSVVLVLLGGLLLGAVLRHHRARSEPPTTEKEAAPLLMAEPPNVSSAGDDIRAPVSP